MPCSTGVSRGHFGLNFVVLLRSSFWRGLAASSAIDDSAAQRNTSASSCGSEARDSPARRRFLTPALQVGLFLTTC